MLRSSKAHHMRKILVFPKNAALWNRWEKNPRNCYIQLGILPFHHRQIWTSFPALSLIRHRDESDMNHTTLKDSYLMLYLGFGTDSPKEPKTFNHHFSREMVWIFKKNECKVLSNCCTKALGCPQHIWVIKTYFLITKITCNIGHGS